MGKIFFLILALILALWLVSVVSQQMKPVETRLRFVSINDRVIEVEVVDTPATRAKGLSGRQILEENTGMLFLFDRPAQYGFWMKDMNFAIDILWIDENYQIVGMEKNLLPETYPQVFYPEREVKYVLELPSGAVDKYQIATGTMIQLLNGNTSGNKRSRENRQSFL